MDPTVHVYSDGVIGSLLGGFVTGGLVLWYSTGVLKTRFEEWRQAIEKERAEEKAQRLREREEDREQRMHEAQELRTTLNGIGGRMEALSDGVSLVRGVLSGVDGRNGLKSDVRELITMQGAIRDRITRVEGVSDEARRRLEEIHGR